MSDITVKIIRLDDPFNDPELGVNERSTVADLKMAISSWWNIPFDEQILVYYKDILDDHKTLSSYSIGDDSKVQLVQQVPGLVPITCNIGGRTVPLRVSRKDRISQVKERILQKEGIDPNTFYLKFQQNRVSDDATVEELGIVINSEIVYAT
ncbi:hypothetical protein GALMADRAFT_134022 [Galerina marginata CBS 339.88]|uniref:Ubiquitin-like domain-containing protein n=1 Tax=Galerina marginata (strain CBS 339.88) TaxID=685588 RepID=A0A067TJ87_GALM3|nr:hypothetical protein GALMADRAFT_134022 [Galerina marginata CBS 339.88]